MKCSENQIENYAANSMFERTGLNISSGNTEFVCTSGNDIFRIIYALNRTYIAVSEKHFHKVSDFLAQTNIERAIRSPLFYIEILKLLGLNPSEYLLEPSEEYMQDIHYNCSHTLEFACSKDVFTPTENADVVKIHRGNDLFILDEMFDNCMYSILIDGGVASTSYFRPNNGIFSNTCAMEVFTRPAYRKRGYGKATASTATSAIIDEKKIALWVSQVENVASIKIAESLGYIFIGGEIRIKSKP